MFNFGYISGAQHFANHFPWLLKNYFAIRSLCDRPSMKHLLAQEVEALLWWEPFGDYEFFEIFDVASWIFFGHGCQKK